MFKIKQIHNANSAQDQLALASVLRIYEAAFDYYPQYAIKIADFLKFTGNHPFEVILLVAQGNKSRVLGFSLSFYFPKLRYAYLDYLATDPKRSKRGYGTALYERTREFLKQKRCNGLFIDVPPDDETTSKYKISNLKLNQRRMAFYEQLGAYPIINTLYNRVFHKGNQGYPTELVYDCLDSHKALKASELKKMVSQILSIKGHLESKDPKLKEILDSIKDNPVQFRKPRYAIQTQHEYTKHRQPTTLHFVTTGDANQIHHLKEKGYVERPARITSILKGLEHLQLEEHRVKHFGDKHILDVHHPSLFKFLKRSVDELEPGQLVYPNVFPIRKPDRIPKNWEMQAGYYCIDTFTPVTSNAYIAARNAVDAALTGAEIVLKEHHLTYVLCRPPGHHAESKAFGGFCYFNNAAIAANFLSKQGKVAFIDIDYHHGNGSQEIFYRRNDVYFISIHGHPKVSYPYFAGFADEKGEGKGKGYNRNFPLYPGIDDKTYLATLDEAIRILKRFKPNYLVVSLGFDIMSGDPTGAFNISAKGMHQIGSHLAQLKTPTLIVQEGGYSLKNLRLGAEAFFKAF